MTFSNRGFARSFAVALACSTVAPLAFVRTAHAQDAAAPAASTATPAADPALKSAVENFWHFGKIARYDLASAEVEKIAALSPQPVAVLEQLEAVSTDRKDNLDEWLLRWANVGALKAASGTINKFVTEGRLARRADPVYIQKAIEQLSINERGYQLGIASLRNTGELAVPFMVEILRDSSKKSQVPAVRRGLKDLGAMALNPLVAATETKNPDVLAVILQTLGEIGYDAAVPYIARAAADPALPASVKDAATAALGRLNARGANNVADLFFDLGEKMYYDRSAIRADSRLPGQPVWFWAEDKGLTKIDVPPTIFNELMTMRTSEYSLAAGTTPGNALALWLAANFRREVQLGEGKDLTRMENQPNAHYYGVSAGASYLNAALARTLRDREPAVALPIIKSLADIGGQSNLFTAGGSPLVDALTYPDRLVRYEAALALAASLPQQAFQGQERIVPLLGEAMSQTGTPAVIVAAPSQDAANGLVEGLKGQGYAATGATSAEAAVAAASTLPAVDVLIVSEDLGGAQIDRLFSLAATNPKLAGAARLVLAASNAGPYEQRKLSDPLLSTTTVKEAAALKAPIEEARKASGALPTDGDVAAKYATRAGQLLARLAISRGQVLNISDAKQQLLASLDDARPEIVKVAGEVLALLNDKDGQIAILIKANDEKTPEDVKVSLYKSLATSAKFFGDLLSADQTSSLEKVVAEAANLEVRSAAAEARGALNLPTETAKTLVLSQSKK